LLRKKKFQTDQLERTEASLDTIEKLIQDLEYTQIEIKVLTQNIILQFQVSTIYLTQSIMYRLLKALKLEI